MKVGDERAGRVRDTRESWSTSNGDSSAADSWFPGTDQRPRTYLARRLLEGTVQGLEERHALRQQRLVVGVSELEPFDHGADRGGIQ